MPIIDPLPRPDSPGIDEIADKYLTDPGKKTFASNRPDSPGIDEIADKYLTDPGKKTFASNRSYVLTEYKSLVENYNNLEPPGREKMIGDKIKLLVGSDLTNSLFENRFKKTIENSLKKNKSFNEENISSDRGGGKPSSLYGPSINEQLAVADGLTTRDDILIIAGGLFLLVVVVNSPLGALGVANALLGGSKHKKRKGRKSKKTKKSMKHKKGRKSKKAKKSMKKRKSMKKKKSKKKRK